MTVLGKPARQLPQELNNASLSRRIIEIVEKSFHRFTENLETHKAFKIKLNGVYWSPIPLDDKLSE